MVALVTRICDLAGSRSLVDDARVELASAGVVEAVKRRNSGVIFEWLVDVLSLQGISDAVAVGYIEGHERISARSIERALHSKPSCHKLAAYHRFYDCGYRKWEDRCSEPEHKPDCPLPRHDLRNGRLNQTAYSLWLFLRDGALGDLVGWIDYQLRPTLGDQMGAPGELDTLAPPCLPKPPTATTGMLTAVLQGGSAHCHRSRTEVLRLAPPGDARVRSPSSSF